MFCEKCGTKNEDGAIFCENCGNKLIVEEFAKKEKFTAPNLNSEGGENRAVTIEKKPMSLKNKIILIVVLVLAVLLVGAYNLGKHFADPKRVVENYVENMLSKNYNDAFNSLDFEDNEFTQKSDFAKVMKNNGENWNFANYTITEELSEDPFLKSYKVSYHKKGASDSEELYVTLVKQNEKKYLLFDDYKVSVKELLAKDFSVVVPEEATVYIDQTKVSEKYVAEDEELDKGLKKYIIPSVFEGAHRVKITMPLCDEKIIEDYYIETSKELEFDEFYLSEDATAEIEQIADKFMREYYEKRTDNSRIDLLDYVYPEYREEFQSYLDEGASNLGAGESPPVYTINSMHCDVISSYYDYNYKKISVYVEADLNITLSFGGIENQVESYGIYHLDFINENGKWFICSMY